MSVRVIHADVLDGLAQLNDESVHTIVTSPPYWNLRDYGVPGQIGLERTPEEFIVRLVGVFREVRRALRRDGTCWLNMGDCYAGGRRGDNPTRESSSLEGGHETQEASMVRRSMTVSRRRDNEPIPRSDVRVDGLKPKDLVGMPWRLAFALQADGWYLRSDIIWHKPNPMPESCRDRPTKAHEYIFLLSKAASYYYDADAIAEPASYAMHAQMEQGYDGEGTKDYESAGVQNPSDVKSRIIANARKREQTPRNDGSRWNENNGKGFRPSVKRGGFDGKTNDMPGREAFRAFTVTRNKRTVWTVTTKAFPGAHFATFPPDLIEPCILAGCPVGGTVLDPFGGAGTTGLVADRLQRNAILIELNGEYAQMARNRITADAPLFANEVHE